MQLASSSPKCPACGAPLVDDAPAGQCPKCLFGAFSRNPDEIAGTSAELDETLPFTPQPRGAIPFSSDLANSPSLSLEEPEEIGSFRLIKKIGEGGFGEVWKAEQWFPFLRTVALKLIKPGLDSPELLARFAQEQQIQAKLEHAHIARLYDAGKSGDGRPYFVMEWVEGLPLTRYCDEKRLSVRRRIGLFLDVCRAVEFAHAKEVIHRDLKPTNVLVTVKPRPGTIKVIDFGIAKTVLGDQDRFGLRGDFGSMVRTVGIIGTPAYMSPEQALGDSTIDGRSDVYSLGAMLYELLTGVVPYFEAFGLKFLDWDLLLRAIGNRRLELPSETFARLPPEKALRVAEMRDTVPEAMGIQLGGELDRIVLKALEKNRELRYATVTDLKEDLKRYLEPEKEANIAKPEGPRKGSGMAPRNRGDFQGRPEKVSGTGKKLEVANLPNSAPLPGKSATGGRKFSFPTELAVALGFIFFAVALDHYLFEVPAEKAREAERRSRSHSKVMAGLLSTIVRSLNPDSFKSADHFERLLDGWVEELDGSANLADPDQIATARDAIASAYLDIGLPKKAIPLYRSIRDSMMEAHGAEGFETLRALNQLAVSYLRAGWLDEGWNLQLLARQTCHRVLGDRHPETVRATDNLADLSAAMGRHDTEVGLREVVLESRRQALGEAHQDTTIARRKLANTYASMGRLDESLALRREEVEVSRPEWFGKWDPKMEEALRDLGKAYRQAGKTGDAVAFFEKLCVPERFLLPQSAPRLRIILPLLVEFYEELGRPGDAEKLRDEIDALPVTDQVARGCPPSLLVANPQPVKSFAFRQPVSPNSRGDQTRESRWKVSPF